MNLSTIAFAAATLAFSATLAAEPVASSPGPARAQQPERPSPQEQVSRARERCQAERGVDCQSASGLKEWVLLERSRAEAVQEGSRHRIVAPRRF